MNERLRKAEQLEKSERDKYLFEYLRLRALNNNCDKINLFYKTFANVITFVSEYSEFDADDLYKFVDSMEQFLKKTDDVNLAYRIVYELIIYGGENFKQNTSI